MAKTLDNSGIEAGKNILAGNVSQSIDAFTGDEAYDVTISGSLVVTGSVIISPVIGQVIESMIADISMEELSAEVVIRYKKNFIKI